MLCRWGHCRTLLEVNGAIDMLERLFTASFEIEWPACGSSHISLAGIRQA